jgi:hypothetical protein
MVTGTNVTGTITDGQQVVPLSSGRVDDDTLRFTVSSPNGRRIVTFAGSLDGDRIRFTRHVEIRPGGTTGGDGLFGALAGNAFVARRPRLPG